MELEFVKFAANVCYHCNAVCTNTKKPLNSRFYLLVELQKTLDYLLLCEILYFLKFPRFQYLLESRIACRSRALLRVYFSYLSLEIKLDNLFKDNSFWVKS